MPWTTTELLAAVRRNGYLPDASDLTDADLLAFGDGELVDRFADVLKTSREEYRVTRADISLAGNLVRFRLPRRALAGTVRGITHVDAAGAETPAFEVPALEAWRYSDSRHYVLEGDEIVLTGAAASAEYLRVRYVARFPRLVATSAAAQIVAPLTTTTLNIGTTPPAAVSTADAMVDIVRGDSPFPTLYADRVVVGHSVSTLTLSPFTPIVVVDVATSTIVGEREDWVCPRDCTVYPPLPQELHDRLAMAIEHRALSSLGDPRARLVEDRLGVAMERAVNVLEPRNQDRKPPIVNRSSRLRGGKRTWRQGYSG